VRAILIWGLCGAAGVLLGMASSAQSRPVGPSSSDQAPLDSAALAAAKAFIRGTGAFPHSPAGTASATIRPRGPSAGPSLGVAFTLLPSGAQIIAIMPGSPAAAAGLAPGNLVTNVNGVALAGMAPDDMAGALTAAGHSVVYGVAGRGPVALQRP
jgi:S1-C subfamily serine protease